MKKAIIRTVEQGVAFMVERGIEESEARDYLSDPATFKTHLRILDSQARQYPEEFDPMPEDVSAMLVSIDRGECYECGEPVPGWDWRTGGVPWHDLCAEAVYGDMA